MNFTVFQLGLVDYSLAHTFQKEIFSQVLSNKIEHGLIICRHNPVITAGRVICADNKSVSGETLCGKGIQFCKAERAGDLTYHGPGQLTVYPVFNLGLLRKDIHLYLRYLEEVVISLLQDFGVKGERKDNLTGVWIKGKKIASIGIAIRHWITFHGLSLNIKRDDLSNYSLIKPCGMDLEMTSLENEAGKELGLEGITPALVDKFQSTITRYYN